MERGVLMKCPMCKGAMKLRAYGNTNMKGTMYCSTCDYKTRFGVPR